MLILAHMCTLNNRAAAWSTCYTIYTYLSTYIYYNFGHGLLCIPQSWFKTHSALLRATCRKLQLLAHILIPSSTEKAIRLRLIGL